MNKTKFSVPILLLVVAITCWPFSVFAQNRDPAVGPNVPEFIVRPGYRVDLVAEKIGEARFLEFGNNGDLYVSQPRTGAIVTLRNHSGVWTKIANFITGKPTVHGMDYHDGWLWFTQSGAVWKARDTKGNGEADEVIKVVDNLPSSGTHWWRSILVSSDAFYTSIGDSGNITDEIATERQKIWKFNLDGTGKTLFASGLRNTEKLRFRPGTDEIWGSDHGSDFYGSQLGERKGEQPFTDHIPGEKFNHYVEGCFYGHPFVVGNGLPRLEFKDRPDFIDLAAKTTLPAWTLPAHWAINGWNFAQSEALGLRGDAIMASHGSWNSSIRVGYRIERILFDPLSGLPMGNQLLVSTLNDKGNILGRPCDVAEAPDGTLFFSDDSRGRIYRISRDPTTFTEAEKSRFLERTSGLSSTGNTVPLPPPAITNAPFTALNFFQNSCARCHGNYGTLYGPLLNSKISDEVLKNKVQTMVEGPAQTSLTPVQLENLTTFIRSIRDNQPYGALLSEKDEVLTGEAVPGSKLWIESQGKSYDISLSGHSWEFRLPAGVTAKQATLHVQNRGSETTLPLSGAATAE